MGLALTRYLRREQKSAEDPGQPSENHVGLSSDVVGPCIHTPFLSVTHSQSQARHPFSSNVPVV